MDLYLLRHGKAEKTVPVGGTDEGRPLTGRGRSEIRSIAGWTRFQGCRFNYIATSPLIRAYETAAIVAEAYPDSDGPVVWEELSPGMEFDRLIYRIREQGSLPSLLLVGHEPSLSALISVIISGSVDARILVKKGGLAKIVNFIPDLEPCGDLVWLLSPGLMQKMG
jgi:phosphohistidine phosphatase